MCDDRFLIGQKVPWNVRLAADEVNRSASPPFLLFWSQRPAVPGRVVWPGNLDTSMTTPFARGQRLTSGVAIASALLARMTVLMGGTFTILILAGALPRIGRDGTPRASTRHRFSVGSRRHRIPLTYGVLRRISYSRSG